MARRTISQRWHDTWQALRYTNFCLVDLPLVPLPEQKAIAEHLDRELVRIDVLVEKIYQAIERLREYRAALISSVVTGKVQVNDERGRLARSGEATRRGEG